MVEQLKREYVNVQAPQFDLPGYLGMGGGGGVGSGGRVSPMQFAGVTPGALNIDIGGGGRGRGGGGGYEAPQQQPGFMDSFGAGMGGSLATGIPEKIAEFQQQKKRQQGMSAIDRALSGVSPDDRASKVDAILHSDADEETKQLRLQYENAIDQAREAEQQKKLQGEQQRAYGEFLNQQAGTSQKTTPPVSGESPEFDKMLQEGSQQAQQANQTGTAPNLPQVNQTDFRKFGKEQQKEARQILATAQRQANEEEKIRIQQEEFNLKQLQFADAANKEMLKEWRGSYDNASDSIHTIDQMRADIASGNVGPHKIRSLMASSKNPLISGLANPESQSFVAGGVKLIGNFKENFGGTITDAKLGIITSKIPGVARLPEGNIRLLDAAEISQMPKKLRYEEAMILKKENGGVLPLGADWIVEERIRPKLQELETRLDGIVEPLLTEEDLATGLFNVPRAQQKQDQGTDQYVTMRNDRGEEIKVHPEDVALAAEDGFR